MDSSTVPDAMKMVEEILEKLRSNTNRSGIIVSKVRYASRVHVHSLPNYHSDLTDVFTREMPCLFSTANR